MSMMERKTLKNNSFEGISANSTRGSESAGPYFYFPNVKSIDRSILIHFLMVSRRIFDKRVNYVERFVKRSGYGDFSRWKMHVCTNLSQNLCDGG